VSQSPFLQNEHQRRPRDAESILRADVAGMGGFPKHCAGQQRTRPEPASRCRKLHRLSYRRAAAFSGSHGWTIKLFFTTTLLVHTSFWS